MTAPRDQYADVGRSARAVMAAACTAGLSSAEWRVLTAVLHETSTWSRHVDALAVDRIVDISGLRRRAVLDTLATLRDRELIVYEARRGRPRAGETARCRIGIPDVNVLPIMIPAPEKVPPAGHQNQAAGTAGKGAPRGGGFTAEKVPPGGHPTEKYLREEEPPPSRPAPAQAAILVAVDGGGRSSPPRTDDAAPPAVDVVLDVVAATLPLADRDRALLAGPVEAAVAAGWDPAVLGAHLLADPPGPVRRPRALLAHRLGADVLPESPAVCPCTACRRHVALMEAQIRRETERLARARLAARHDQDGDAEATRHDAITEAIGPALHGRIVAAAIAANPVHQRRPCSPARLRGIAAAAYADHQHDVDAIRAYAASLPAGPAETAPDADDGPTPGLGGPVRLRRAEGA